MDLKVTVLVDGAARDDSLSAEHGLSLLLDGPFGRWLMDAGASGDCLLHNAAALGVDLPAVKSVILSHGHYDHSGGLLAVAMAGGGYQLYCHPEAFVGRFVEHPGRPIKPVGPAVKESQLREAGVEVVEVQGPMRAADGLLLSGPVGGPKAGNESFVIRRGEELIEDAFSDELFALARGRAGWVLLNGCCHRGLANTLRLARFLTHAEPIAAIVGGLHLRKSGEDELADVVALLKKEGSPPIHAGHCTGSGALRFLSESYPGTVQPIRAGDVLEF